MPYNKAPGPALPTTLSLMASPFPLKKTVNMTWQSNYTYKHNSTTGMAYQPLNFIITANRADYPNISATVDGTHQTQYFSTMCSLTGPYKSYKVISWKTIWTITNLSGKHPEGSSSLSDKPVMAFATGCTNDATETLSLADALVQKGTTTHLLPPSGRCVQYVSGSYNEYPNINSTTVPGVEMCKKVIITTGNIGDVYPGQEGDNDFQGSATSPPSKLLYATLTIHDPLQVPPGSGDFITVLVHCKHLMQVEFSVNDAQLTA